MVDFGHEFILVLKGVCWVLGRARLDDIAEDRVRMAVLAFEVVMRRLSMGSRRYPHGWGDTGCPALPKPVILVPVPLTA